MIYKYEQQHGPEVAERIKPTDVVFVPLAAPENHGRHLPLGTDTYVSEAMARRTAELYAAAHPELDVYLYPAVTFGGATIRGPGSVKIKSRDLQRALYFFGKRLIKQGFRRILFFSGHGGVPHVAAMDRASARLTRIVKRKGGGAVFAPLARMAGKAYAGMYIDRWKARGVELPEDIERMLTEDLHGGMMETAMMLDIRPDLVHGYKDVEPLLPPKRRWLDAIETGLNWFVNKLPISDRTKTDIRFSLVIGKHDLSWIIRGRLEGYCGYPALATAKLGDAMQQVISEDNVVAMDLIFDKGGDPAEYRSGAYLLTGLARATTSLIFAIVALIFIGGLY
jgi:creatinine amidohydrolase/Fe(II)-dependent formamide hydrolase-like protein